MAKKITLTNEIMNTLKKDGCSEEQFINDAKTYLAAVKSGRILYTVTHVSTSGMSRNISIKSFEGSMANGSYRNYFAMLRAMGYKSAGQYSHDIKVSGGGMPMTFATNYAIIHALHQMGFINRKVCDALAQRV